MSSEAPIDTSVPHSARIWNYWLGGKDNYEVDRAAGDAWKAIHPGIVSLAQGSRAFLARAVTYAAGELAVRQFLDVGTGLPTADNTHEVAQRVAPDARIVYVDNDPLVLAHARALLTSTPEGSTRYVDADMRDTQKVLDQAAEVLDFTRPVALIFQQVLGHVADLDEARGLVAALMTALPSGSYLILSDGGEPDPAMEEAGKTYADTGAVPYIVRPREDVLRYFEGLELVEPGFVFVDHWRPPASGIASNGDSELPPVRSNTYGGVARKP